MNPTTFITPACRIAFPSLFKLKPRFRASAGEEVKLAYQAVLLFPPGTDFKPFTEAMKVAMTEAWGKVLPADKLKNFPIRACDSLDEPPNGYLPGWHFINTSNSRRVVVTDRRGNIVTDEEVVYGGMWVRANLNAWCWDKPAKGCSLGLNGVQILRDDEPFAGVSPTKVAESFGDLGDLSDEELGTPTAPAAAPKRGAKPAPKAEPTDEFDFGL